MNDAEPVIIEQHVQIKAPPETVWQYWVDPARLAAWWGASAEVEPRPGGTYRVTMAQGPVMSGHYVELVPHERLVFTFGWEGNEEGAPLAPGSTRVEVELRPEGDGTALTVRHHAMPATHAPDHEAGWAHYLGVLAAQAA